MVIVHISPSSPYNNNWGYQENLLPKYHAKLGNYVTLIITNTMHSNGMIIETDCCDYISDDGVRIVRLKWKKHINPKVSSFVAKLDVYDLLCQIHPDYIFYHGLLSQTIFDVIRYKRKIAPQCIIVQDNHLDYNIGLKVKTFKDKLKRCYFRALNKKSKKYVKFVYGVTPWRKKYAEDYFHISPDITDTLIMGADDDNISFETRGEKRKFHRGIWGINEEEFVVISGGKNDKNKNIIQLMQAVKSLKSVKLIIFGSISDDIKDEFNKELSENVRYIGWIDASKVYDYYFAADLIIFPGQHSVLWEQACASKVPCVFKRWEGMEHVNNGGNVDFLDDTSSKAIKNKIVELMYTDKYIAMSNIALSKATDIYLYSSIAKKSLNDIRK